MAKSGQPRTSRPSFPPRTTAPTLSGHAMPCPRTRLQLTSKQPMLGTRAHDASRGKKPNDPQPR